MAVRIDSGAGIGSLAGVAERAGWAEAAGYDGLMSAEINNDPFLPLALAAAETERIELVTGIAVAFARNPMTLAQTAHDLQLFSGGRVVLGLGSQIKPHITRRFSMPWSRPAARMREFILAMRAIWATWNEETPLDFEGEFYRHTLMTPMFTPQASSTGPPKVMLAAVGPSMTRVAAEVADGVLLHAFTTARYAREVSLPAIEEGLAAAGRERTRFQVSCPAFIVSGPTEAATEQRRAMVKAQISFYGSTPAYKPVLDLHGWGDLHAELNRLSKQGRWDDMGPLIGDEVLDEFAVVAGWDDLPGAFAARWGGLLDRTLLSADAGTDDPDEAAEFLACIRSAMDAGR